MPIIILTKNPSGNVVAIVNSRFPEDNSPPIMEFDNEEKAKEIAEDNPLCQAWGYQLVEVTI